MHDEATVNILNVSSISGRLQNVAELFAVIAVGEAGIRFAPRRVYTRLEPGNPMFLIEYIPLLAIPQRPALALIQSATGTVSSVVPSPFAPNCLSQTPSGLG